MKKQSQDKDPKDFMSSLKRSQGSFMPTLTIKSTSEIFNKKIPSIIVLEEAVGQQIFFLERNEEMIFTFYHFSPGTGTREASVDMNKIIPCPELMLILSWSPSQISFTVIPTNKNGSAIDTVGKASDKILRVGTNGKIYHLGNKKERIMLHLAVNGELVIQPTAIEVWKETLLALDALATGKSTDGKLYETAVSNMSIVMLVTGFESYAKKRFLEIEDEGIAPNEKRIIKKFYANWQRTDEAIEKKKTEANQKSISLVQLMALEGKINFQEFDKCKHAFNLAYNIQFYHLGMEDSLLNKLKIYFKYRHRIIHIHPAAGTLNPDKAGLEEPVVSDKELIKEARSLFDEFIKKLHKKTLDLLPEKFH